MANRYDTNLKLQEIADAIGDPNSNLVGALEDIKTAIENGGGGGGGTTVVPNPPGTPTDTLDSVLIGSTIYEVGGGATPYREVTLYTGSLDLFTNQVINLSDDYTNYDAIRFEYYSYVGYNEYFDKTVDKSTLTNANFVISDFYMYNGAGVNITGEFTATDELTTTKRQSFGYTNLILTRIVGIKRGTQGAIEAVDVGFDNTGTSLQSNDVQGALSELNSNFIANVSGASVALSSTSYTFPSDGYVICSARGADGFSYAEIKDGNGSTFLYPSVQGSSINNTFQQVTYVKKGMSATGNKAGASSANAVAFVPLTTN